MTHSSARPVNIKVIHTKDFVKITVKGVLDFALSRQALLDIASQIEQSGQYKILVDTREAKIVLSTVDIFESGEALTAHPSIRRNKIAFLTLMNQAKQARFFEDVAVNRGIRVKSFTDFDEAIVWLEMPEAS